MLIPVALRTLWPAATKIMRCAHRHPWLFSSLVPRLDSLFTNSRKKYGWATWMSLEKRQGLPVRAAHALSRSDAFKIASLAA